jgi:UDP-N-acetylmuramate--alanine ligase
MTFKEAQHIHCIGIGGIGLSALARLAKHEGKTVSGSDTGESKLLHDLKNEGMTIHIGNDESYLPQDCDLVIHTIAIKPTDKEFVAAKSRGVTCMSYPEALGEVTKNYTTIAVSGTHGKTTTTAMLASAMKGAGLNPTVIVGSLLTNDDGKTSTNFIAGDSKYLIVEACEYRRSFLNLHPAHIIITNIDNDHLDYYKDLADSTSSSLKHLQLIKFN